MQYCHHRTEDKLHCVVYMVTREMRLIQLFFFTWTVDATSPAMENFDLTWQETVLHGSIKQGEGSLRGIGGGTRTTGVKEFYVGLEGENGERVPAKTASTSEDPALESPPMTMHPAVKKIGPVKAEFWLKESSNCNSGSRSSPR